MSPFNDELHTRLAKHGNRNRAVNGHRLAKRLEMADVLGRALEVCLLKVWKLAVVDN